MSESTGRLVSWRSIESGYEQEALLLGNGASRNLWDGFAYSSLLEQATHRIDHPLTEADQRIFESLESTTNFERVLNAIGTAKKVAVALGHPTRDLTLRYKSIQRALIESVSSTHVPWNLVPDRTLTKIRRALEFYEYVFTINYDLIAYWAIMSSDQGAGFIDYFLHGTFNEARDWTWARDRTKVLYLHGGIHLYQKNEGGTIKRAASTENLLRLFEKNPLVDAVPLFISEGDYRDKVRSIHRNDYLSFALGQLASHKGRLVIFGSSLGAADRHLVEAINSVPERKISVGLRRESTERIIRMKARFRQRFTSAELSFFDASTHPLGDPALRIPAL